MHRIDSHCHLWELVRGDYNWLDINNPSLAAIARDFSIDDLVPLKNAAGVDQLIVVQAAATEAETDYLLSLASEHDDIAGVVGWVDIVSETAALALIEFASHAKFKGIRPMLQDIEDTQWLVTAPDQSIWQILISLNLRLDALVQPRHLQMLHQFCQHNDELPIVIDHIAKPKQAFAGDADAFNHWARYMRLISVDTDAYCKVSGLLTELSKSAQQNSLSTIKPAFDHLLECFGPSRLMWGSDWPVLTLASDYAAWHDLSSQLISELSQDEQVMIMGGSAVNFYGLTDTV